MNYAPQVTLPDEICPLCWNDSAATCRYVPGGSQVWATHCSHRDRGAVLDLGDGSAKPRWSLLENVDREEWALLLAASAHAAQRLADEAAAALADAAKH